MKYSTLLDILETAKYILGSMVIVGGDILFVKSDKSLLLLEFLLRCWGNAVHYF